LLTYLTAALAAAVASTGAVALSLLLRRSAPGKGVVDRDVDLIVTLEAYKVLDPVYITFGAPPPETPESTIPASYRRGDVHRHASISPTTETHETAAAAHAECCQQTTNRTPSERRLPPCRDPAIF